MISAEQARPDLREVARRLAGAALAAVEPGAAVRRRLRREGTNLILNCPGREEKIFDLSRVGRVVVVGAGKAGEPMAAATVEVLGAQVSGGLVVAKYRHRPPGPSRTGPVEVVEAAHPVPDAAGVAAARRLAGLVDGLTPRDLVIALFSGGGSALLSDPAAGVSLEDLSETNRLLLACGAPIEEINAVRKHLSRVAGGQLARRAAPAAVIGLLLSDVVGDPLDVIASGPTVPDRSTFADAWAVVTRRRLADNLPEAVKHHLTSGLKGDLPETPKPGDPLFERVCNVVVGSNHAAAQAAAEEAARVGFSAVVLGSFLEGEAREAGRFLAGLAKSLGRGEIRFPNGRPLGKPACLILGGETTVTLQGEAGTGGRNQETALSAALALEGWDNLLAACLATDGGDGPTSAAGAFADGCTAARARQLGLDPVAALARHDAFPLFERLGDLIVTGPTLTNVNDLAFLLAR